MTDEPTGEPYPETWWQSIRELPGRLDAARRSLAAPMAAPFDRWWARRVEGQAERWGRWESNHIMRRRVPLLLFVLVGAWYFSVFASLVWRRHEYFGSFDYDLGMYDQGIWQLAHGRGFMTIRGMHVFGHHANLGYFLFVPFYWVGIGGPHFLDMVNTLAVVATAVPIYALGRRHLRSEWAGFWLAMTYLFHFSPQWKIQETFHPESLAVFFLAGAWYFASVGRWRWYAACIVLALIWKEDVAIAVAVVGPAVAIAYRAPKVGILTSLSGVAWFAVATKLFMPAFQDGSAVFDGLFGQLGSDATAVVRTSMFHPTRLWDTLRCHGVFDGRPHPAAIPIEGVDCPQVLPVENLPPRGWATLAAPYGLVPAAFSPHVAAIGAPQHVVNYATTADFTWDLRWHYAFLPYLGVLLSTIHTVVRRSRVVVSWVLIAVMVVGVAATSRLGVGPWTMNHDSGNWPLVDVDANRDMRALLGRIPDDAAVSASYVAVPHLSHRERIYTFPNPWRSSNYGVGGIPAPPDPNVVDYLLVRRDALNEPDRQVFDAIVGSGQFDVIERRIDLFLMRRVATGPIPVGI